VGGAKMKLIILLLFLFAVGCEAECNSKYENCKYLKHAFDPICVNGYEFVYFNNIEQIIDKQGHGIPCIVEESNGN
jgi:hypothetical protein